MQFDRRQVLALAAGIAAPALRMSKAEALSSMSIAWRGRTGVNVFWPFGGPVANNGDYLDNPYADTETGDFSNHIHKNVVQQLRRAGVDHVRLQVNPGPWLQRLRQGRDSDDLSVRLDGAIDMLLNSGLGVLLSPYLGSHTQDDTPSVILSNVESQAFARYRALLVNWSRRYRSRPPSLFAVELMNEPPHPSNLGADWRGVAQPNLYRAVRSAAPSTTIVVTAENYSSLYLLCELTAERYDANVIYTFHPFLPSCFCLQGAAYDTRYKYVSGLSYPPRPSERGQVIQACLDNIAADLQLSPSERKTLSQNLSEELGFYFDMPGFSAGQDRGWLRAQFKMVTTWAAQVGLPASALYVGEWGAVRQNHWKDSAGRRQGANADSRARYYSDIAELIGSCGFRSSLDHLDTYDYGVTCGSGSNIQAFDPFIMEPVMRHLQPGLRV